MERIDQSDLDASWQLIEPDGTRFMKEPAAARLLEDVRSLRHVAALVRTLHLQRFVGLVARFFKLIRKWAGKAVPDVERTIRWP